MFTEIVENSKFNRGNFKRCSEVKIFKREYEAYYSIFQYPDDYVIKWYSNHFKDNGRNTLEGFDGPVCMSMFWVDFDAEGRGAEALADVQKYIKLLNEEYECNSVIIYYSGNKGFHVGIPSELFGIPPSLPHKSMPSYAKQIFHNLTRDQIETADTKIYDRTRIFRIPMSLNIKSGRYKIYIPISFLQESRIRDIERAATECFQFKRDYLPIMINPKLNALARASAKEVDENLRHSSRPSGQSVFLPTADNRNDTLFKMAYRLYCVPDFNLNEIKDIMEGFYWQTMQLNPSDFERSEFDKLMESAYSQTRDIYKNKKAIIQIGEWAEAKGLKSKMIGI